MKNALIVGMSSLLFWGCGNPGESKSHDTTHTLTENHAEHHYNESTDALELDNGKRWLVNEEMKPFVSKGSELVSSYIQDGRSNYKELADEVREQNTELIRSCTMTGKSHDELHKWLHPHMALVEALDKAANSDEARNRVQDLEKSYEEYHVYFQ